IQRYLARSSLEMTSHARWVRRQSRGQGSNDHGSDIFVHRVRGNDQARTRLPHLHALGEIEIHQVNVKPAYHHGGRSESSNRGALRNSRSTSGGPYLATAALNSCSRLRRRAGRKTIVAPWTCTSSEPLAFIFFKKDCGIRTS